MAVIRGLPQRSPDVRLPLRRPAAVAAPAPQATDAASRLASCIYTGQVRHRRHLPMAHAFQYRLFLMYLDLAEIDELFEQRWVWSTGAANLASFRRADYLGDPALPLDQCVRDCVQASTGRRPAGPIRLLAHLRYFGHCFNPVAFYYCFAADGQTLETIVAEVTNTPWRERHQYVLPVAAAGRHGTMLRWSFPKALHVSPFMGMDQRYRWRLDTPGRRLRVHMEVFDQEDEGTADAPPRRRFDASLALERIEISPASLRQVLLRYPLMTMRVVLAIHWQALRLWARRVPVHDHPPATRPAP